MNSIFEIFPMPLLTIFVGLLVYFTVKLRTTNNTIRNDIDKIVERENNAYFVRKKDIPYELFLSIDKNLPFDKIIFDDSHKSSLTRLINEIKSYENKKFLKPDTKKSNIELKEEYGHNSLDEIISYEQNFNRYIIHINSLAEILVETNQYDIAETFLNEAKKLGSDVTKTYTLLIDIYANSNKEKLDTFISEFKSSFDSSSFCYIKTLEYYSTILK